MMNVQKSAKNKENKPSIIKTNNKNQVNSKIQQNQMIETQSNHSHASSADITITEGDIERDLSLNNEDNEEEFDGGYGWLVVLGAFCVQVTSFGIVTSWGVMQDYYYQNIFSGNSKALVELSFVGTLALIFINGMSPFIHVCIARYGLRQIKIVGTLCITIALEMASFTHKIWHLYLSQGILFGLGASCLYVTIMAVTPQWFTKNRGIALGIVAGGSGIGGLVMPLIITPINRNLGPSWTYRILGLICLVCDAIACILVKERVAKPQEKKKLSKIVHFDVLKDINFLIYCIGSDIALFGYFIPFFFVPAYATHLGMPDSQGSSLVAVMSAMNFIGRLVAGYLADRIGKLNSNIIFTLISAISCLLIWTFAYTYETLMGFSIVFGFFCGSYFALLSPISASILGMERFPSGLSLLLLSNSIPVFGSTIASSIESAVQSSSFFTYKMFAGITYLIGAIILIVLKFRLNKKFLAII
ncbi:major facilitator superfamily domain-containing protein [Cokeromyces recurvatus]|uniref:major facilitator superfamily domain-containing protein n=1 Tax=Cokeromyces recurvatus TaxID=90255 RepID=UPI00221FD62E|nr:major facilitator superfamily domain-containing protein [Cokeromyces recurvatus]KAI7904339.1 major facilitator superfamily domain-containing protein [Cokeromyces recurvatus]